MGKLRAKILDRWNTSSHFMSHRFGRFGLARSVFGAGMEAFVWTQSLFSAKPQGTLDPKNILVFRNNDFGDLLASTPLFQALHSRFPQARITAAVGKWNLATLENNPNIDEIMVVDAPWYNHFIPKRSTWAALKFVWCNEPVKSLRAKKFDLYIDVVGTHFGAMLGMRAGIPWRVGVKGYAGGHSAMAYNVPFVANVGVAQANLRAAELLGASNLPLPRPQLYLNDSERVWAQSIWDAVPGGPKRIVIGPGIGSEGRGWPIDRYAELAGRIGQRDDVRIVTIGGKQDAPHGEAIKKLCPIAENACGKFSLRQSFAAVSMADLVICNNSMLSHAAAAFARQTIVLLGPQYVSTARERGAWGYDGISEFLGREGKETQIATVDEAFEVVVAKLG